MKKLVRIQNELKAPKGNINSFGHYKYRSCEDILTALKPLLIAYGCTIKLSDDIVLVGDRYYIKATATIKDEENNEIESTTALARECEDKKGMDASQLTGTTSSYARKYALNGLFGIDDTKDADTDEFSVQTNKPVNTDTPCTDGQKEKIKSVMNADEIKQMLLLMKKTKLSDLSMEEASDLLKRYN